MGCNDYNLHLDGSEGGNNPTPEFKIYLDGVGVNGYSPTVNYVQAADYFRFVVNDIDGIKTSPKTVKYDWLTDNYALKSEISNATITLTQGGVTKGTFTLNGSATTINLDAGGGSITNPLQITNQAEDRTLSLGIDDDTNKILFNYNIGGVIDVPIPLLYNVSSPLVLTKRSADGLYTLSLDYDTATLGLDASNKLTVIGGGGGTTYTAGTGIDITSNVISIDTDVVAQLSDIPDVSDFVTSSSLATTLADYVLSSSLASVATSGSYTDLLNKPTIPTNSDYVDLTSNQTIGGIKTFSSETHHTGVITFDSAMLNPIIRAMSGANYRNMIYRMGNDSAIIVGNSNDTIDLKGSGTRPTYNSNNLALYSDIPSLVGYIQNTATSSTSLTIDGIASTATHTTNVGYNSEATASAGQAFGHYAKASGSYSLALGQGATASNSYGIQLGKGTNSTANTLSVGFGSTGNYELLNGTTGLIPDARLSTNIARISALPSLATTSTAGIVQPDGSTITVSSGVISAVSDSNKANTSLNNITSAGEEVITGADKPDYTNYSSNYVTNTEYTASDDMWVEFTSDVGASANYINSGNGIASAVGYINTAIVYQNQISIGWDAGGNTVTSSQIMYQMYRLYKGDKFRLDTSVSTGGYITTAQIYTYPIAS